MYCTVLYFIVLYCTVLYCTVLYCTVLYCTALCYTSLHLYCAILLLYLTLLYCTSRETLHHGTWIDSWAKGRIEISSQFWFLPHGTMEKIDATESTTIVENFLYYRELLDDMVWMTWSLISVCVRRHLLPGDKLLSLKKTRTTWWSDWSRIC